MAENEGFTQAQLERCRATTDRSPLDNRAPQIAVGDAMLRIVMDSSSVDLFITRLERAVAAFKAEWNKEPKL